ncbi:MAG: hypothetical protein SOX98_03040 [Acidaminococcus fermentans]|nr:hypothetical protein [Acidaminococcus fermentans]
MIIVTYQNLPPSVPAVVQQNPDDSYTIIINEKLSDEKKRLAMKHEVNHIVGGDLFKEDDVDSIETSCHASSDKFQISEGIEIYVKDGE